MDRSKKTLGMLATTLITAAGTLAPAVVAVAPASAARAQATEVEPYYVVVKESNVNLRCGAGQVWYAVGKVDQGQVLRVDGHEFGWLRVGYPAGMGAIVRANDAEFDPSTNTVTLVRESKLQANNPAGGVSESWRQLLDEPLPADSVLQHLETLRNASGEVMGYRVAAPGGARGFVSESLVRMATEPEVQRFLAGPAPATTPANAAVADRTAPRETEAASERTQADSRTPVRETEEDELGDAIARTPSPDENEEIPPYEPALGEDTMADASDAATDESEDAGEASDAVVNRFPPPAADAPVQDARPVESTPMRAGGESIPAQRAQDTARPGAAPVASYADLNRTFEEVMRQPTEGAEYEPLINEFQRLIESLPDEPGSDSMRAAAGGRIAALRLRADLQATMARMSEALASADAGSQRVQESAETLDANPVYRFVGRLGSSTVYNGQRLPLLFRVQAVDSGRTIAYLTPSPELDLTAKLNSVVGVVVGHSRDDSTLGLPLIDAKRVDVIRSEAPQR